MKIRKLLVAMRLWARACRARRENKRLRALLMSQKYASEEEKKILTKHYEKQLALERTRNETIHVEWANRLLESQKLLRLGISTTLLEERAIQKLAPQFQDAPEDVLTPYQLMELEDRKAQFFNDGLEMDKSLQEIQNRWEDIKDDVIMDVKMAIT